MKTYGTALLRDGYWHVKAEPQVIMRMKRLFGKASKQQRGVVVLSDTLENCRELAWFFERYPMQVEQIDYLQERASAHRERSERLISIVGGAFHPRSFKLVTPLRRYQEIAAELTLQGGALLLADDVGLGKTASAIGVISDPAARPALVVTLTHLPRQWEAEIKKFAPALRIHILKKGTPYPIATKTPLFGSELPDVIISNYHKLAGWSEEFHGIFKSVIFDEVQELRRPDSNKYSAAAHISEKASFRMGLSATPIHNLGGELFNVFQILKPDVLGTKTEFDREWCSEYRSEIKDPKSFGSYLRDQGLMLRRTRQDVGRELPPLIVIPHHVDTDQAPLDEVVSAAAELARIILAQGETERGQKLRASEELSWRLRQATGIAKARYVADFVRMLVSQGEKVLLFGWHREVYSLWLERLADLKPAMYTGSESAAHKAREAERFTSGDAQVLIMSLRAGAGVDGLQASARTVVFGELDWSPAVHEQAIGRLNRDGQGESVAVYYLVSDEGSDPVISGVLGLKRQQLDGVRNPDGDLIERLTTDENRIKKLAEAYLEQRGLIGGVR